jgi:hypothetical protein
MTRRVAGEAMFTSFAAMVTALMTGKNASVFRAERLKKEPESPQNDSNRAIQSAALSSALQVGPASLGYLHLLFQHLAPTLKATTLRPYDPTAGFTNVLFNGAFSNEDVLDKELSLKKSAILSRAGFIKKLSVIAASTACLAPMFALLQEQSIRKEAAKYAREMKLNAAEQTCVEDILALKAYLFINLPNSALFTTGLVAAISSSAYRKAVNDLRAIVELHKEFDSKGEIEWTNNTVTDLVAGGLINPSSKNAKHDLYVVISSPHNKQRPIYQGYVRYIAGSTKGIKTPGLYCIEHQGAPGLDQTHIVKHPDGDYLEPLILRQGHSISISV